RAAHYSENDGDRDGRAQRRDMSHDQVLPWSTRSSGVLQPALVRTLAVLRVWLSASTALVPSSRCCSFNRKETVRHRPLPECRTKERPCHGLPPPGPGEQRPES